MAQTRMMGRGQSSPALPASVAFKAGRVMLCLIALMLLLAITSIAQDVPSAPTFSITGVVKSGNTPIPGATVTAINSSTQEKTTTSTDTNGAYTLQVAEGKYQLQIDMAAFAPSTREIVVGEASTHADLELHCFRGQNKPPDLSSEPRRERLEDFRAWP